MPAAKTAIITGANTGLGLESARTLLQLDPAWHVVLAVRDPDRGAAAARALQAPERTTVMHVDLGALASITGFVLSYTAADLPPLHAVICNAGLQVPTGTRLTADGFELTFGVNHLGHFALVHSLLGQIHPPARIVVVSSDTHDPAIRTGMPAPIYTSAHELAHPTGSQDDSSPALGRRRYTTSKLCNMLFAYELDRRLGHGGQGISVNAFNPGLMPGSGLARDYSPIQRFAWNHLLPALRFLPQVGSTRSSGQHLAKLADDARFEGVTGNYFDGPKIALSSRDSYDREKALDLWTTSEELTATG